MQLGLKTCATCVEKIRNLAARKDNINNVEETFTYDNYVQDPTSQQGFNRYAYCLYNPLRYTDPSGERRYPTLWEEMLRIEWTNMDSYRAYKQAEENMAANLAYENALFCWFCWGANSGSGGHNNSGGGGGGGYGRKEYESPISDNCGKQNGECVYRCLEEFSESYGIKGGDFDYWCDLATQVLGRESINENGTVTGVDVWELDALINNSDYFSCGEIGQIVDSWCDAFDNNDRMMIIVPGHAAMIQSLTIDRDGYYTMRFAETSCDIRHVPYYSCNLIRDIPGCRIFKISLKP